MAKRTNTLVEVDDLDDMLDMTLKLRSGRFESTISVPLRATDQQKQDFIASWFKLMEMGLRCQSSPTSPTGGA